MWRCRACNRVFKTPKVADYVIPPGDDGRRYVFAESIPRIEQRARRRSRRSSTALKLIAATTLLIGIGAVGYFVFMDGSRIDFGGSGQRPISDEPIVAAVPQSPTPILAASIPTPIPTDTPTPTHTSTPQPSDTPTPTGTILLAADTPTLMPPDAVTPSTTPVQPATRTAAPTPRPADTPTPVPSNTPAPTSTPTRVPASALTPVPTSMPTPIPTNTPVPVVRLVLDAESTVLGYWSDGTADVEVTATLRNEGTLRLDGARELTATCIAEGDERRDCREELSPSLPDGFAPTSESFTLRLPMGATSLKFDYGESEPLTLDIDVPERILGVDRDLWECYVNRPPGGVEIDGEVFAGCGGWSTPTVKKWLNDVPVKVWATGHPDYIAVLETVLIELAPILNLEFESVDAEEDADFKAYVGVDRAHAAEFKFDSDPTLVHAWGFGSASVNGGEATSGRIVIWDTDLGDLPSRMDAIRAVTIHEALHALGPIGHRVPLGHSSRPLSVMEVAKLGVLLPRERQLFELNSHPLVRPGMSMDDVRKLVVITEDLLDYPLIESEAAPDDPLDLIRRAYVELERAGSASFRLSGGWTGDETCNRLFGVRRGPIEMSIGDFSLTGDWPTLDPGLVHLHFGTSRFLIRREDGEWLYWWLSPKGTWETVYRETVVTASSYWLWNGKLLKTLRSVLWDGTSEDIRVEETADGNLRLQVTLDHSYVYLWKWGPIDKSLDFTLVVDPKTFAIVGYTWELHRDPDVHSGPCLTFKEVATDGRLGVDMDKLVDQPEVELDATAGDSLDIVWQAYLALEKAGSASFRLSGGWIDRGCNQTFGVRRGPIELSIGDFRVFGDNPALSYLDMHTNQFYIVYSRADKEWTHWTLSPQGTWERGDHETIADASNWWVWNGKLHAAIRGVLRDGSPEDIKVDETSDGNLRLQVTLDKSYVNLWKWGPIDKSLHLTLLVNPDTFGIEGYTWRLNRNPDVHTGPCLTYQEVATEGRLSVAIAVPEVIKNELAAAQ